MANKEMITDFIDERAFAQFDKLKSELKDSQSEFADLIKQVASFNSEITKSKSIDDLTSNLEKATKATEGLSEAEERQEKTHQRVAAAKERVVQATKANIEASAMDNTVLKEIAGGLDSHIRRQVTLREALKQVTTEQKQLNKEVAASDTSKSALARRTAELAKSEVLLKAQIQQTNLEIRRRTREEISAEGSADQLAARLDQLRGAYRSLTVEQRNAADEGGVLLSQINKLDAELKQLDANQGVYNRNVGNYVSGTNQLTTSLGGLFPQLEQVKRSFDTTKNSIEGIAQVLKDYVTGKYAQTAAETAGAVATDTATAATVRMSRALQVLRVALLSTGIGAIVVALGTLITYLATTQAGIDRVTSVTRPLRAVLQSLLGVVQDVGKYLFEAFTNPRKVALDLLNFVRNQIIPTFDAFRDILSGIVTLDFERMGRGLDFIGKSAKEAGSNVAGFFTEAIDKGREVDRLQKEIEEGENDLIRTQGSLNRLIREQGEIARDRSKSDAERQAAAKEAIEAINELTEKQLALQDKRIEKMRIEDSYSDTSRADAKEMAEIEAERDNIYANAAQQRVRLTAQINSATSSGVKATTDALKAEAKAEKERTKNADLAEKRINDLVIRRIELEQERADRLQNLYRKNASDENNSFDERLENLDLYLDKKEESIQLSFDKEKQIQKDNLKEVLDLEKEGRKQEADALRQIIETNLRSAAEREAQVRIELAEEATKLQIDLFKSQLTEEERQRKIALDAQNDNEILELEKLYATRGITQQKYEIEKYDIQKRYNEAIVQNEVDTVQRLIEANREKGLGVKTEEEKLADLKIRLSKLATDSQIKDLERLRDREKEINDARKELSQELFKLGTSLFKAQFERDLQGTEQEIENLNRETEAKKLSIEQEVLSEEDKRVKLAVIENQAFIKRNQLEDKQRQIQIRQARFDRAVNIAGIIGNTARGVTSALATFPPNVPLSILIGAIGAAQIAQVMSSPLPKFWTGTESSPEGFAHVGEKGTELVITPSGQIGLTPNRDTITYLQKGTQIIDAEKTKSILAHASMPERSINTNYSIDIDRMVKATQKSAEDIKRAISSRPEHKTILTKRGLRNIYSNGSKWKNYKNNLLN